MPHSSRGLSSPDRRANRYDFAYGRENNVHDNSSSFKNEESYCEAPYEKSTHDMNLILFNPGVGGNTENNTGNNSDNEENIQQPLQEEERKQEIPREGEHSII